MKWKWGKNALREIKSTIDRVLPDSIAGELGIEAGDVLASINGQQPRDLVDYRFLCADDELEIEIIKKDGEVWVCDIQKEYDEDLGLGFAEDTFDGIMGCVNKCIFCFVDQMPPDMRESLYVKDDDYRLSFLHGNFVTLTNLQKKDWERIIRLRISPIHVSVHCTNPQMRELMLGHKRAGKILDQLTLLAKAGIDLHTQIVLCPGINDGEELDRTIRDVAVLWPHVKSMAVVPVGLTRHRNNLRALRKFTSAEASGVIDQIHRYQHEFLDKYESPLVYVGDEFYVAAGREFPESKYYGDYPQMENGVGLVRFFYDSFEDQQSVLPIALPKTRKVAVVTGVSGESVLRPVIDRLNRIENLQVELVGVFNEFFGGHVTVAGLLTGNDLTAALRKRLPVDCILLPSVMCKRDEPVFLDGKTIADLSGELNTPVQIINIEEGAGELITAVIKENTENTEKN